MEGLFIRVSKAEEEIQNRIFSTINPGYWHGRYGLVVRQWAAAAPRTSEDVETEEKTAASATSDR